MVCFVTLDAVFAAATQVGLDRPWKAASISLRVSAKRTWSFAAVHSPVSIRPSAYAFSSRLIALSRSCAEFRRSVDSERAGSSGRPASTKTFAISFSVVEASTRLAKRRTLALAQVPHQFMHFETAESIHAIGVRRPKVPAFRCVLRRYARCLSTADEGRDPRRQVSSCLRVAPASTQRLEVLGRLLEIFLAEFV